MAKWLFLLVFSFFFLPFPQCVLSLSHNACWHVLQRVLQLVMGKAKEKNHKKSWQRHLLGEQGYNSVCGKKRGLKENQIYNKWYNRLCSGVSKYSNQTGRIRTPPPLQFVTFHGSCNDHRPLRMTRSFTRNHNVVVVRSEPYIYLSKDWCSESGQISGIA